MKKYLKLPERNYIKNALILAVFALSFFMIDWLTKHFVFSEADWLTGKTDYYADWGIVAFTSLGHPSTTFLSFINVTMDQWIYDMINMMLLAIFVIAVFFSKNTLTAIGLSVSVAGIMGNGMDMLRFDYVRDILVTPWVANGTAGVFNFADTFIIAGAGLTFISLVIQIIKEWQEDKKKKKEVISA